ncbi:MAG: glucosylceramidase [Treponema sp.]|nr:glucosylceramidase [Treponema sp.]
MVTIYETSKDTERRFYKLQEAERKAGDKEWTLFSFDVAAAKDGQTFKGFGGAITESAGYVLSQMKDETQKEILQKYFDSKKGNAYSFVRTHLNSCDFSLENWACVPEKDESLESFSMERPNKYMLPAIHKAAEIVKSNGRELNLLISPWSPPTWMKDNNDMNHGGKLLPQYKKLWAQYFCKFILELQKQGLKVSYVTIQNEPEAKQVWDSCLWTGQEEGDFAVNYLYPAFKANNLADIKILVWDHNRDRLKERFEESMSVANATNAEKAIGGAAFHWYSGDQYDNLKFLSQKYPDKDFIFTEGCIEGGPRQGAWFTGERYAHNIINDLNNGCTAWIDWNIVLNMEGGPNHVGNNCDAPILANPEDGKYYPQSSYYYIGHFSRFIKPGAIHLDTKLNSYFVPTTVTATTGNDIEATAFKNPDGSVAIVVMNRTEANAGFVLTMPDKTATHYFCPPRSIQTFIWEK